jgi:hypothetical protein
VCRAEEPALRPLDFDQLHWTRCHHAEALPDLTADDRLGSSA